MKEDEVYANTTRSEPVLTGRARKTTEKRDAVKQLIADGVPAKEIAHRARSAIAAIPNVRRRQTVG